MHARAVASRAFPGKGREQQSEQKGRLHREIAELTREMGAECGFELEENDYDDNDSDNGLETVHLGGMWGYTGGGVGLLLAAATGDREALARKLSQGLGVL